MMETKKIYYVCFYTEPECQNEVVSYPSVWSKIEYITAVIKKTGSAVEQLCIAPSLNGTIKGKIKIVDNCERHIYLTSSYSQKKLVQIINAFIYKLRILFFLLKNVRENDKVLVYHSLFHKRWLWIYKKIFKRKFILEIEDVFSELDNSSKKLKDREWQLIHLADAYLCINELVASKLSNNKKVIISYGNYSLPKLYQKEKMDKIRLVYAGVIEQERKAAFLAVDAMKGLPDTYELHILGFGDEKNIICLKKEIDEINNLRGKQVVFLHDRKSGEQYYKFLQTCDIALSTHSYDESNMNAADNTFPSKVLVYLANGLRVVAQQLECLQASTIGDLLYYYSSPNAQLLADVIRDIDLSDNYDSRTRIDELNRVFCQEVALLLEECGYADS